MPNLIDNLYVHGQLITGSPFGIGNIYYVVNTSSSSYADMVTKLGNAYYDDGSKVLHPHTATASTVTTNGIKTALAACVADRNDYVIVMPSTTTYYTDEALSITKKGVHLICPGGMGCEHGATNAARIQQITANTGLISIAAQAVEVAGLYLKHSACAEATYLYKGAAIDVTTGASCPNIHHNYFAINGSGATNSPIIAILGGATGVGAWGQIHHNRFVHLTDSVTFARIILINTGANTFDVSHNVFNSGCGAGATVVYFIEFGAGALYGEAKNNFFTAGATNGPYGITESTLTACIYLSLSTIAIGNRGAVQSGLLLAGGVAARSFCDNLDGRVTSGTDVWNLED